MPFVKGQPKSGGRTAGVKNERTLQWGALGESIVTTHTDRFNSILANSKDKEFSDRFLQVLEYFKPKLNRTTLEGGDKPVDVQVFMIGDQEITL